VSGRYCVWGVWGRSTWDNLLPARGRLLRSICGGGMFNNSSVNLNYYTNQCQPKGGFVAG